MSVRRHCSVNAQALDQAAFERLLHHPLTCHPPSTIASSSNCALPFRKVMAERTPRQGLRQVKIKHLVMETGLEADITLREPTMHTGLPKQVTPRASRLFRLRARTQEMPMDRKKVTLLDLLEKKEKRIPITMLTTYDYPSAQAVDRAGIDIAFVGDSYGMVVLGYDSTVPVTMEEMLIVCRAVARGARTAFLIGDMPFMSYQVNAEEAVRNAGRFVKEAGMDGVKLEGGRGVAPIARAINAAGISVMGHIGLTPQNVTQLSGWRTQGTTAASARALLDDALALEDAGCFAIVLEKVPDRVAQLITERVGIPTIGIGAGPHTSGQVLVLHDLLGYFDRFLPKFAKRYANLHTTIGDAIGRFKSDVEARAFPGPEHVFTMGDAEWNALIRSVHDDAAVPPERTETATSVDTSSPY